MNRTSNTNLSFLFARCFICFLDFPNVVMVTDSCANLVIIFDERVLLIILNSGLIQWVFKLASIQQRIVDVLCFLHEWPDTINTLVVAWLVFNCSFANCVVIEDVLFFIIVFIFIIIWLPFINENLRSKLFNFNIPTVV
jgi:hypothetical protein